MILMRLKAFFSFKLTETPTSGKEVGVLQSESGMLAASGEGVPQEGHTGSA